jgi:hypothetical protein
MTLILVYLLGFVFSLCEIILYIPCYFLSKEDPDLLIVVHTYDPTLIILLSLRGFAIGGLAPAG